MTPFNTNLRTTREKAGVTRQELADNIGISVSALGQYEQGRREPDLQKLVTIAAALHVSVDDLLGYHVDDFDKAAALFHESTGETATLNGDKVNMNGPLARWKWRQPINKAVFVESINSCVSSFDTELRPRLLKHALIDSLDRAYRKEYGIQEETTFDKGLKNFFLQMIQQDPRLSKIATDPFIREGSTNDIMNAIEKELRANEQNGNEKAAAPAQDHAADDDQAKEKGPHSKE
ncbi:helix-turn-helix domain-containing protein [Mitsuokella multacida]